MEYGAKLSSEQQQQLLFMMLVQQHEQIGMMGLGKLKDPSTDTVSRDLNAAKYAIDTLRMLETYTKGNLTSDMKSYLTHVLSTLQLNYVDEVKKPASDTAAQASSEESPSDAAGNDSQENGGAAADGES
ncbi:MAG: protein of unknown function containing DUF1844 domain [Bacteroidetes bacterium HLUCCA01]|nr:MAG: protein of unknown function containing DUF1844 domain [Bacteroidetes bacterium HLUCCA01]